MMMMLAGLALVLVSTGAFAQQFKVKSKGTASAVGEGDVRAVVVTGTVTATFKGNFAVGPTSTKITIKGTQGKKTAINDKKTGKVNGYKYEGVDGVLTITGQEYMALFEGKMTKILASGAGTLTLVGSGTYSSNNGPKDQKSGKWAPLSTPDYTVIPTPVKFGDVEVSKPPAGK
jgi:Zn-dependent alcohol dehydrogenase